VAQKANGITTGYHNEEQSRCIGCSFRFFSDVNSLVSSILCRKKEPLRSLYGGQVLVAVLDGA
jgi:hypothetical protein